MTEPVSQMAEVRKFLFLKDSRPIGPTIDAKITAAVQEINEVLGLGYIAITALIYGMDLQVSPFLADKFRGGWEIFVAGVFCFAVFGMIRTSSQLKPRMDQSGIPNKRAYGTTALSPLVIVGPAWVLVAIFGGLASDGLLADMPETRGIALLASAFVMFLYTFCFIQERTQWIFDLREEQGHMLAQGTDGDEIDPNAEPAWYQRPAK
jgi:hypothetical protein